VHRDRFVDRHPRGTDFLKKGGALVLLALVLLSGPLAAAASGQTYNTSQIVVQVSDQNGVAYSGISVTIYSHSGSATSSGMTLNGLFVSDPLPNNSDYTVLVSSGTENENQTVTLSGSDVFVSFTLTRPPPLRPRLVISDVAYNPTVVTPGSTFEVVVSLNNTGIGTAYAGTVTLSPGAGINLEGNTGTASIGPLAQNESTVAIYHMSADPTISSGFVPVGVRFSYTDINGLGYNDSSTFNIQVVAKPDVRVGAFALSVAPLRPGISSVLSLTLINVGGDRAYDVSVAVSGQSFLRGGSINYLGSIASSGVATAQFFLSVLNTTAVGSYSLVLNIHYSDVVGNQYNKSADYTMGVESFAPPSVSVTNILLDPPVLTTGATGTVTLFLANAGPTAAANVIVNIVNGTGIVASNHFGLGTMGPGAQVTQVVGLNVDPGLGSSSRTLQIVVTYQDPNGNTYTSTVPYQTYVFEAVNPFSLANIGLAAGLVLLALVVLIMVRKYNLLEPLTRFMSQ
jgi:mRNA-degrading endonuclease toxin of MazEF toxin-antitoxin module